MSSLLASACSLYVKKYNFFLEVEKKCLQCGCFYYILIRAVALIALKREVAADRQVFRGANVKLGNWRQVTVSQSRCLQ